MTHNFRRGRQRDRLRVLPPHRSIPRPIAAQLGEGMTGIRTNPGLPQAICTIGFGGVPQLHHLTLPLRSGAYRGDGKTAKDAAIIADQARMRRDLRPLRHRDKTGRYYVALTLDGQSLTVLYYDVKQMPGGGAVPDDVSSLSQ
jgi:hypothetical protein